MVCTEVLASINVKTVYIYILFWNMTPYILSNMVYICAVFTLFFECFVRSKILTVVNVRTIVLFFVTPCSFVCT
jgi:hypothetical protein